MARGNRRETIFHDDDDRRFFLATLSEACAMTGWRVHAWVLMGNHNHLFIETPEANLVAGMSWLQNTVTRRYHVRHQAWGRLFGDRYKAVVVSKDAGISPNSQEDRNMTKKNFKICTLTPFFPDPIFPEFCSEDLTLRGVLVDDDLTIFAGYASDLCSPGFYLFGRWFGTPSKGAEIPAFIHDFARQFMRPAVACSPWDSAGSDVLFYNALTMVRFPARDIYHGAVSGKIGNIWQRLNRPRHAVYCRCVHHFPGDPQRAIEKWAGYR